MADKREKRQRFIEERARALAIVHLTRRDDLVVKDSDGYPGLDLRVTIVRGKKRAARWFGVALAGTWSATTVDHVNETLKPTMQLLRRIGPFPFPVCLFHFTMEDNQGHYTWV